MDEGRKALSRTPGGNSTPLELLEGIKRIFGEDLTPEGAVSRIVSDVALRGDDAVREYTRRIDGIELEGMELDRDTVVRIAEEAPQETREALRRSVGRIRDFHVAGLPRSWMDMERGFGGDNLSDRACGHLQPGRPGVLPVHCAYDHHPGKGGGREGDCAGYTAPGRPRAQPRSHGRSPHRRCEQGFPGGRRAGHCSAGLRHGDRSQKWTWSADPATSS